MAMGTDKYLASSEKVNVDDLDWEAARTAGLSEDEAFVLTYFCDIEGQTIVYLRDFLHTRAALEPDVIAFLSMWNYEEYFHGRALAKLLDVCGYPLDEARIAKVRSTARVREKVEAFFATVLSKIFAAEFPAVYMTWGAIQELTTLRGYEQIIATTKNPVVAELCRRIAKQERRHYAWYFNSARERLEASPRARKLTRALLKMSWTPVGAGVKQEAEVFRLMNMLFPGDLGLRMADGIDERFSSLPGLDGLTLMHGFLAKATADLEARQPRLLLAR